MPALLQHRQDARRRHESQHPRVLARPVDLRRPSCRILSTLSAPAGPAAKTRRHPLRERQLPSALEPAACRFLSTHDPDTLPTSPTPPSTGAAYGPTQRLPRIHTKGDRRELLPSPAHRLALPQLRLLEPLDQECLRTLLVSTIKAAHKSYDPTAPQRLRTRSLDTTPKNRRH